MPSVNEAFDLSKMVHNLIRTVIDETLQKPTLEAHDRETITKLIGVMAEQIEYQQRLISEILSRLPPAAKN